MSLSHLLEEGLVELLFRTKELPAQGFACFLLSSQQAERQQITQHKTQRQMVLVVERSVEIEYYGLDVAGEPITCRLCHNYALLFGGSDALGDGFGVH